MLELLAYTILLLVVMPALFLGAGKLIAGIDRRPSRESGLAPRVADPAPHSYDMLHERLAAAAAANPLLPRVFTRSKPTRAKP